MQYVVNPSKISTTEMDMKVYKVYFNFISHGNTELKYQPSAFTLPLNTQTDTFTIHTDSISMNNMTKTKLLEASRGAVVKSCRISSKYHKTWNICKITLIKQL